jgi:hypothetical protein
VAVGVLLFAPLAWHPSDSALTPADVARIDELDRVRRLVGDQVWPGWGSAVVPVVLVKRDRAYLFDHPSPPRGFVPLPEAGRPGVTHGRAEGLPAGGFGAADLWGVPTAVVASKEVFGGFAALNRLGDHSPLEVLAHDADEGADSAQYVVALAHESFHAFARTRGAARLDAHLGGAGRALDTDAGRARLAAVEAGEDIRAQLCEECRRLQQAIDAGDEPARLMAARGFLAARAERRAACIRADPALATLSAYEQQLEWTEGMARYTEHALVRALARRVDVASTGLRREADVRGYAHLRAGPPVVVRACEQSFRARSYAVGSALCLLLDRLDVPWKTRALDGGIPLDEILSTAVAR